MIWAMRVLRNPDQQKHQNHMIQYIRSQYMLYFPLTAKSGIQFGTTLSSLLLSETAQGYRVGQGHNTTDNEIGHIDQTTASVPRYTRFAVTTIAFCSPRICSRLLNSATLNVYRSFLEWGKRLRESRSLFLYSTWAYGLAKIH